jgi:hypothetical protein
MRAHALGKWFQVIELSIKVKLSLCFVEHHAMKTHRELEV